jgi:glycerophosphoryl diester phosphodiesterase
MTHKPLIIAHRGASIEAPENTMPAFQKAKEIGVDGVELDILLSKDGHFVVTHDESLFKLTRVKGKVENLTLNQLKLLDYGSHFSKEYKGEKIPTLEEVFDLLKKDLLINIEIKGRKIKDDGREQKLAQLIRKRNLIEQVVVSSFNILALRRMYQVAPEIRRGYLFFEKQFAPSRRAAWAPLFHPYSLNISKALVQENTIEWIHQRGYRCWVWTVNDEKEMLRFAQMGADAIITDDPRKLVNLFKNK